MRSSAPAGAMLCVLLQVAAQCDSRHGFASGTARGLLGTPPAAARSNENELALVMLLTDASRKRIILGQQAIQLMARNLLPTTPSRLYVFTIQQHLSTLTSAFSRLDVPKGWIICTAVRHEHWVVPPQGADVELWHGAERWGLGYRLMGEWRLRHMPRIMRDLGHRYLLQVDCDSFVCGKIGLNIVKTMKAGGYLMASRWVKQDAPLVNWGLAELAKYFLVSEKHVPVGPLLSMCEPPNLSGLYTHNDLCDVSARRHLWMPPPDDCERLERLGVNKQGGWKGLMLNGNFLVIDLDFWYTKPVQRFVHLCRTSGGSMRYRWNEQGVVAMVWQIFVPTDKLYRFEFEYYHRYNNASCEHFLNS